MTHIGRRESTRPTEKRGVPLPMPATIASAVPMVGTSAKAPGNGVPSENAAAEYATAATPVSAATMPITCLGVAPANRSAASLCSRRAAVSRDEDATSTRLGTSRTTTPTPESKVSPASAEAYCESPKPWTWVASAIAAGV